MPRIQKKLRHGVQERLRFIEFRLYWEGAFRRKDLVDQFGISVQQASADIALYRRTAESNLHYDSARKRFVPTADFSPRFFSPSSEKYLQQLCFMADETLVPQDQWLGCVPEYAVVPSIRRRIETSTVRDVVGAICGRYSLLIRYQSLTRSEPTDRQIAPHALVFDGFRWHARAWCFLRERFSDFVLARIMQVRDQIQDVTMDRASDLEWQTEVRLRIGPHPDLDVNQRSAIEIDFGMHKGVLEIKTRLTLAYYLERRLYLDLDPSQIPPARQQIVLLNREELRKAKAEVSAHVATSARV